MEDVHSRQPLSVTRFIIAATVLNIVLFHYPLFRYAFENIDTSTVNSLWILFTLLVVVTAIHFSILTIIGVLVPIVLKPFFILIALLNAASLYFMINYNVVFDLSMMGNIVNTRSQESLEFLHPKLFLYIIVIGVLCTWLSSRVELAPPKRIRLVALFTCVLIFLLGVVYLNSTTWLWFDKHSKQLGGRILPWSYLINAARHNMIESRSFEELSLLPAATFSDNEKMVVVLVIGETARASNFSLYGYQRQTNPLLQQVDISVLEGATSCSTYTTASLHCMLSHTGKATGSHEILPSYLYRHGVDVVWRKNNWGAPPFTVTSIKDVGDLREYCNGPRCMYDEVLLSGLEKRIRSSTSQKILVILHTKGSHGPLYSERYPKEYEVFKPVCRTVELDKCTQQELVNAYDNTILYTDSFLNQTIELLKNIEHAPVMMMYVSDHGESLGEYGLYLHGTPYTIAPDVQKDIPFFVWMSDRFQENSSLSHSDLERFPEHTHSQVFHSILGVLSTQSEIYNPELNIFHR